MNNPLRAKLRVAGGGRIVIPAEVRQRLGFEVGSEVTLTVENDHATLMSAHAARRRAQQLAKKYGIRASLSRELMDERKKEARRE